MKISGESVSGIGTRLYVSELGLTFDIGSCPVGAVGTSANICITHGHMDHIGQAAYLRSTRAMMGLEPPRFFLPFYLEDRFKAFMTSTAALEDTPQESIPYHVTLVHPGMKYEVKKGIWVEPLASPHTIPMLSYVVWKDTKKLKPEFLGLHGLELGVLRRKGVVLEDAVSEPVFAYTGDTTAKAYEVNPILLQVHTLAMEMTFFQDYHENEAKRHGHTHINDLIKLADKFENKNIVLVHNSARYSDEDKEEALNSLPEVMWQKARWL